MSLRHRRRLFCTILSPPLLLRPLLSRDHLSSPPFQSSEATLHEYQRDHAIFGQGDPVDGVYVILQGCVEISARVDMPIHVHQVLFLRARPVVLGDGCHGLHWAAGEKRMAPSPPPHHHHRNGDGGSSSGKAPPVVSPLAGMGRALGLPSKQGVVVTDAAAAGLIGGVGPAGFNAVEVRTNERESGWASCGGT